jgi:hypothetical protein
MTFLIILTIIFYLIVYLMPKHRTKHEVLTTIFFALLMSVLTDLYLDVKYHLYWYFNKDEVDWEYLFVLLGQPPVLIIILNFFPVQASSVKKFMYIVLCSGGLMLLEGIHHYLFPILHYGKWNIWYSAAVYPCTLLAISLLLRYVKENDSS